MEDKMMLEGLLLIADKLKTENQEVLVCLDDIDVMTIGMLVQWCARKGISFNAPNRDEIVFEGKIISNLHRNKVILSTK
jgi:hypothetical protein